jgi:hypothetical protein
MAKRLATKNKKRFKDQAVAYAKGEAPARHKVAEERSKKALKKNMNRAY